MKAKSRRSTHCSNCESQLDESFNFCPVCGQSNTTNNITFGILISEFIDNYLGLDSKIAHSLGPFLFSPGKLTNRFQDGKIKHFIHPVRLYLVLSVFYFFVISYLLSFDLRDLGNDDFDVPATAKIEDLMNDSDINSIPDSLKISFVADSLRENFKEIKSFDILYDSLISAYGKEITNQRVQFNAFDLLKSNDEPYIEKAHRLARDRSLTNDAFIDSISNGDSDINLFSKSRNDHAKAQIRKIFVNDQGFKGFLLGNLPLMMFILIPLFAGVLKLIYVRRKHLYIKHIVHALHVHSFAYLMYGISLLIIFKLMEDTALRWITAGFFFILVSTYVYISFLNVYKQGWFKTLIKFNIVGFIYSIFLQIFFYFALFISFWYY
ncbi:MAG: hypothetical protein COW03_18105 [Cytophagales bacterium CG12_big_fil_rev_8_21_14_0_65_40_12]|nr:MAG: hypothetical protein COW03_18105 [Cytophagales bacterium CG12_big_fil_rev_8_21_14_0_65_40_12]PIW06239.1 MAG: hypothetical protein COW40_00860 [Cytophagales bacterium CG17_big_fil_post_rev_8_21_14_2_50_40_13]